MKRTMNMYQAHNQWRDRPADERFWTLAEMLEATRTLQAQSAEAENVMLSSLEVKWGLRDGEAVPLLVGGMGIEADFTHHSFGQMAQAVQAPAEYLRRLPPELICQNMNFGLNRVAKADPTANRCLLLRKTNGHYHLGAALSERYDRIWDADVTDRLIDLQGQGWRVPPARPYPGAQAGQVRIATEADVLANRGMPGLSINVGDAISPAGLYASDHDMFAFLVNEDGWIESHGQTLGRGFFVANSEVGDRAFVLTTFLYNTVCGNHIVWGAEDIKELRVVHLGAGRDEKAFGELKTTLTKYAQSSAADTVQAIEAARTRVIATEPDEVVDLLFSRKVASRQDLEAAQLLALTHPEDAAGAAPNTAWGMAQGLTRLSQKSGFADKRDRLDRAAGKVLKMRF